jgi:hypothetical protein
MTQQQRDRSRAGQRADRTTLRALEREALLRRAEPHVLGASSMGITTCPTLA